MTEVKLFAFFLGIALCLWRAPRADRWHVVLVFIAGTIWGVMMAAIPELRSGPFTFVAGSFLVLGLFQVVRRRRELSR